MVTTLIGAFVYQKHVRSIHFKQFHVGYQSKVRTYVKLFFILLRFLPTIVYKNKNWHNNNPNL